MSEEELIAALSVPFYEDFAERTAQRIREAEAVGVLYRVATASLEELPKSVRHKVLFRSAYVLETIWFDAPELLKPYLDDFCTRDFPACTDASARRHFAKIMADLLRHYISEPAVLERIAETVAAWAVDPAAKVAVRVWAVEVLAYCRSRIGWVEEAWGDLLALLENSATPGIAARLRRLKVEL